MRFLAPAGASSLSCSGAGFLGANPRGPSAWELSFLKLWGGEFEATGGSFPPAGTATGSDSSLPLQSSFRRMLFPSTGGSSGFFRGRPRFLFTATSLGRSAGRLVGLLTFCGSQGLRPASVLDTALAPPEVLLGFGRFSAAGGTATLMTGTMLMTGTVAGWLTRLVGPFTAEASRAEGGVPTDSAILTVPPTGVGVSLGARTGWGEWTAAVPGDTTKRSPGWTCTRGSSKGRRATKALTCGLLAFLEGTSAGFLASLRGEGAEGLGALSGLA